MSSKSSNQSSSYPVQTPENDIINQLSGVAAGLATQMQQWAQGAYAENSQVTNQSVGNFFHISQKMLGLGDNLTDQYNNVFAPQNRQLAAEANSYNSTERQRINMGMAGATQAQAGEHGRHNAEAALKSYGINPADGQYASLEHADAVQNAANIAGAMNMQRDRDAQTGRELRSEAVRVGAQLPAAISNVHNTGIQANTGASNASLANSTVGANLNRIPNDYLKTAMDVKLPPMGSQSTGESMSADSGGMGGISSKGWPSDSGSSGGDGGGSSYSGGGSGSGGSKYGPGEDGWSDPSNYTQPTTYGGQDAALGALDTRANQYDASDFGGGGARAQSVPADFYGDRTDANSYGGGDYGESYYAQGGAIPDAGAHAGPLPPTMSPSGGQQTDDIQAQGPGGSQLHLNAGEFVIPEDVALWKGQEFFQQLIDKSRKMRMTAPAQGGQPQGAPNVQ